jgi:hypothetical protein
MSHAKDETALVEKKMEPFFNTQLLKIAVACFTFIAPIAISFFIWIAGMDKRLTIVEEKQNTIVEMRDDIKQMGKELNDIKLQLAKMNRGNP